MFESEAVAFVNTVNLNGVMGKGVALQFKQRFPMNFKAYRHACQAGEIGIGKLLAVYEQDTFGNRLIINFPTKTDWRRPSEYAYIESGLEDLRRLITEMNIPSVAVPPLGAGNGGLNWIRVKELINKHLGGLQAMIYVYEPNAAIKEQMKQERVRLTRARALLLYMLYELVRNGEFVSEFSSEKVCYFLQRFGGRHLFRLEYRPYFYGPYSGKVKYVLNALNGSYIMGYSDMDKKPFEPLSVVADAVSEVTQMVENDPELYLIAEKTARFLDGFYSDFGLELLSSVDYLRTEYGSLSADELLAHLSDWNKRKQNLFCDSRVVGIAVSHLDRYLPL